jgi:preprotein translocase subunit SecA
VIGRAARQSDPGSAERWLRLDDSPRAPHRLPAVRSITWPRFSRPTGS